MLKRFVLSLAIVTAIGGIAAFTSQPQSQAAFGDLPPCPTHIIMSSPQFNQSVSGTVNFALNPVTTPQILAVTFYVDNTEIGPGSFTGSFWQRSWNSTQLPNSQHFAWAKITLTNTSSTTSSLCSTATQIPFTTFNATNTTSTSFLEMLVNPPQWAGPTNTVVPFSVETRLRTSSGAMTNVTTQASYSWSTSIGAIDKRQSSAIFTSGPTAGKGILTITASYNGQQVTRKISLEVANSSVTANYPTLTTQTPTTPTTSPTTGTTNAQIVAQNDIKLKTCLEQKLGERAGSRMSFKDFSGSRDCFKDRRYVVPVNLAPVEPSKVKNLPESIETTIHSIRSEGSKDKPKLVFSGRANPNQQVFIYVFSEPLVLTAQADKNGLWSYTLEDPLASGEHEAFVAVEKGNNEAVRSSGSVFGVSAVAATPENPSGLSLLIEEKKNQPISLYIFSALSMIVLSLGILLIVRHKRHHAIHGPALLPATSELPVANPSVMTPTQPVIPKKEMLTDSPEEINDKSL